MGPLVQRRRPVSAHIPTEWRSPSPFCEEAVDALQRLLKESTPEDHGLFGRLWTIRKLQQVFSLLFTLTSPARSTIWKYLRKLGFSWKKTKKILAKANTEKREAYLKRFEELYAEMCRGERTLLYIDEAHVHQDMDLGYGWGIRGTPFRIASTSPGLSKKINWYGAYDFTNGRAFLWAYPKCNGENTADFLEKVAKWTRGLPNVTVVWDGSPVHRAKVARKRAEELGIELVLLPGYSPDLNPIEGLWKWLREEVTYGHCHESVAALFEASKAFVEEINKEPLAMTRRLWPKMTLDPAEEELRLTRT